MAIFGYLFMLLVFIVPVILIIAIIAAVVKRYNNKDDREVNFEKIMRTLYVYVVLIASLFLVVFATICLFNNAIGYFVPESTVSTQTQNLIWLLTSIAELVVGVPIFAYHSKLAKKL